MDSGDYAWMLISTALVVFMIPGLALFYGGMTRSKNVLNMFMMNMYCVGIVPIVWVLLGYSLGNSPDGSGFFGGEWIGNFDFIVLKDLNVDSIPNLSFKSGIKNKQLIVRGEIFPFVKTNNHFKKILFLEIELNCSNSQVLKNINASIDNSVLSSGNWYKISLNTDGIYRLSYQDLETLGFDVSSLNPEDLRIYGHPGGLLPIDNFSERTVDLEELAIQLGLAS